MDAGTPVAVHASSFCRRFLGITFVLGVVALGVLQGEPAPDFNREVAPILSKRCLECHSGPEPTGKFSLLTRESFQQGGESGSVTNSSHPEKGELIQRVSEGLMPPKKQGASRKLPESEIALLRAWINAGAPWPEGRVLDPFEVSTDLRGGRDLWSLQPIRDRKSVV